MSVPTNPNSGSDVNWGPTAYVAPGKSTEIIGNKTVTTSVSNLSTTSKAAVTNPNSNISSQGRTIHAPGASANVRAVWSHITSTSSGITASVISFVNTMKHCLGLGKSHASEKADVSQPQNHTEVASQKSTASTTSAATTTAPSEPKMSLAAKSVTFINQHTPSTATKLQSDVHKTGEIIKALNDVNLELSEQLAALGPDEAPSEELLAKSDKCDALLQQMTNKLNGERSAKFIDYYKKGHPTESDSNTQLNPENFSEIKKELTNIKNSIQNEIKELKKSGTPPEDSTLNRLTKETRVCVQLLTKVETALQSEELAKPAESKVKEEITESKSENVEKSEGETADKLAESKDSNAEKLVKPSVTTQNSINFIKNHSALEGSEPSLTNKNDILNKLNEIKKEIKNEIEKNTTDTDSKILQKELGECNVLINEMSKEISLPKLFSNMCTPITNESQASMKERLEKNINTTSEILHGYTGVMSTVDLFTGLREAYENAKTTEERAPLVELATGWFSNSVYRLDLNDSQTKETVDAFVDLVNNDFDNPLRVIIPNEIIPKNSNPVHVNSLDDLFKAHDNNPKAIAKELRNINANAQANLTINDYQVAVYNSGKKIDDNISSIAKYAATLEHYMKNDMYNSKDKKEAIQKMNIYLKIGVEAINNGDTPTIAVISALIEHCKAENNGLVRPDDKNYLLLQDIMNSEKDFKKLKDLIASVPAGIQQLGESTKIVDGFQANNTQYKTTNNGSIAFNAEKIQVGSNIISSITQRISNFNNIDRQTNTDFETYINNESKTFVPPNNTDGRNAYLLFKERINPGSTS